MTLYTRAYGNNLAQSKYEQMNNFFIPRRMKPPMPAGLQRDAIISPRLGYDNVESSLENG
jgi:hypothetical protein